MARRVGGRARPQARWPQAVPARSADALAKRTINTTDPDSARRCCRTGAGSVQGYNAQVVAQPAADHPRRRDHPVRQRLRPARADDRPRRSTTLDRRRRRRSARTSCSPTAATGTRRRSRDCASTGSSRSFRPRPARAPNRARSRHDRAPRPSGSSGSCDTTEGRALYRRRQQIVEPVFAHTKFNRGDRPLPTPRPSRLPRPNGSSSPPPTTSGDETARAEGSGGAVRARG